MSNKLVLGNFRLPKKDSHYLHKKSKMSIASLDVAPNSVVSNDASRDFDPVVAFGGKFPIAFVRQ